LRAILKGQCPNCGGDISDERLELGLPCEACIPKVPRRLLRLAGSGDRLAFLESVCRELKARGTLRNMEDMLRSERDLREFEEFFERAIGNRPWSAQKTWARRVLGGKSFTILAPTGVGKSVFGVAMALFLASRGRKSYIVLPTSILVRQVYDRAMVFAERTGLNVRILAYTVKNKRDREELKARIAEGDYDVLITTSQFLARQFDIINSTRFDFVFVDDVDAVIKSSRNVDKVLSLLGIPPKAVEAAYRLIRLKLDYARAIAGRRELPEGLAEELSKAREELGRLLPARSGVLVISTATGRPRGLRIRLFREILGFEIGSRAELIRKVVDAYKVTANVEEEVAELAARLGGGGLIFVPTGVEKEYVESLLRRLEEKGVKASFVEAAKSKRLLDAFERGEIDVLVGYATYYGLLVRGLDMPHVIRYALFAGTPHFKFTLDLEAAHPLRLLQLASTVRNVLKGDKALEMDRITSRLRRSLLNLNQSALQALQNALQDGVKPEDYMGYIYELVASLRDKLRELMADERVLEDLRRETLVSVKTLNGRRYILIPDVYTYLQASGRTSRMYAGGISRGLSVVVTDDEPLLMALTRQTRWYSEEVSWSSLDELDLAKVLREVDEDRRRIRGLLAGEAGREARDLVRTALVVVESPTKARTIASFFGKPSRRRVGDISVYEVSTGNYILLITASKGHVIDLTTDEGLYGVLVRNGVFTPVYTSIKRCASCGEQFTSLPQGTAACPNCGSQRLLDQASTVEAIRSVAREVDLVLLATDPDTEGEKIAWDLQLMVAPYTGNVRRIEFHEVTRRAFEEALSNPRPVQMARVEAQMLRRVEDRWIGFLLSKKLWSAFGKKWLSAGRVQTPVLGWIVKRFEEARDSVKPVFSVQLSNGLSVRFEYEEGEETARSVLKRLKEDGYATVSLLDKGLERSTPPPPFSTDTLLREAVSQLRLGVDGVMRVAQDLFEMGLITYHRTDSVYVSAVGIGVARTYVAEKFGAELFRGRQWGPPGTHECIRPTRPYDAETLRMLVNQGILQLARPLSSTHYRLYDLIFRRFIASQMREALVEKARFRVSAAGLEQELAAYTRVVEPGYTLVYTPFTLSSLAEGRYKVVKASCRRIPTVTLYTQADVIARMKEEKIGRPSTYSKIVSTLLERRYVVETRRRRLLPTKLGIEVYYYLEKGYRPFISVERTRVVEEKMDMVERGEVNYLDVLREFYKEVMMIEGG